MYYIACCDDEGKCIGYLTKEKTLLTNPSEENISKLMSFKAKKDTNEIIMQVNLSRILPNGYPFRAIAVKA